MNCMWKTCFALALLFPIFGSESAQAAKQPNLIVIMTDDLGYADVGFNGYKQYLSSPYARVELSP